MPYCKNCHQKLSRFDKDICPFCGTVKPLEGQDFNTVDITTTIESVGEEKIDYKPKRRLVTALLCALTGIVGGHALYLKKYLLALECLIFSIIFVGSSFLVLYYTGLLDWLWALSAPLIAIYIFYILFGVFYLKANDIKDGNGNHLI